MYRPDLNNDLYFSGFWSRFSINQTHQLIGDSLGMIQYLLKVTYVRKRGKSFYCLLLLDIHGKYCKSVICQSKACTARIIYDVVFARSLLNEVCLNPVRYTRLPKKVALFGNLVYIYQCYYIDRNHTKVPSSPNCK